jgi:hypothetical protein
MVSFAWSITAAVDALADPADAMDEPLSEAVLPRDSVVYGSERLRVALFDDERVRESFLSCIECPFGELAAAGGRERSCSKSYG